MEIPNFFSYFEMKIWERNRFTRKELFWILIVSIEEEPHMRMRSILLQSIQ